MINKNIKKYIPLGLIQLWRFFYNKIRAFVYFIRRHQEYHTYAGFPLKVHISDPVSAEWYDHDWNRDEITFLKKHKLKKGARVFNIGAHQGIVALILSKIVENFGKVVAVEMDPNHVKKANINKRINNVTNLKIIQATVSEKSGSVFFTNDQINIGSPAESLNKVRSISIDGLTKRFGRPSVIYMDIEGYEYRALKGAKKTLRSTTDWCIEIHVKCGLEKFNGSVKRILSYFPKSKFNLFMAPSTDKCDFVQFKYTNNLIKERFYLIAISKID